MLPDTFGVRKILFESIEQVRALDGDTLKKAGAIANLTGKVISHARLCMALRSTKKPKPKSE